MQTMRQRPAVRWRRYGRLVATNFLRGASYACGTAVIGLAMWWARVR
ncbi:hypothetical protein H8N01_32910 [Streptomyces sp. AC536]|nr:hypothetical protein [Streptomyces buecherae]MBC3987264.1 hypothetical protein [Streptomyces buecherae]QNJ44802.1 hypothetical protein H7H31_01775 [Streptomyces buecherae]